MSLDPDDVLLGNIFESVVRTHQETGADVVQFEIMRSINLGPVDPWDYCLIPKDVLNNEELRQAVIRGQVMWNRVLLSVERELNVEAFKIISTKFNRFLFLEEDRLQTYVIFYFTDKFVQVSQRGYLYFHMERDWPPAEDDETTTDRQEVQKFLLSFYDVSTMNWFGNMRPPRHTRKFLPTAPIFRTKTPN
jgi:hypothetical protein